MYCKNGQWTYSPSDLTTFMDSPFASWMNRYAIINPEFLEFKDAADSFATTLQNKGYKHEAEVVDTCFPNKTIIDISKADVGGRDKFLTLNEATIHAMKQGFDVIFQGALSCDSFSGYADFLVKVEGTSALGDFHYEVWDSKLAMSVKPYFVVQLCCYAEMLEHIQGVLPQNLSVVLGNKKIEKLKTNDYFYYYLALKDKFLNAQSSFNLAIKPNPFDSKSHGTWSEYAAQLLAESDHLSLIANISRNQIKKLEAAGIYTCAQLIAYKGKVSKLNPIIFQRLKQQATLQYASKGLARPKYVIMPHAAGQRIGLSLLPPASKLDVFFDIEGYPLLEGGLEYLWGNTYFDENGDKQFKDYWAHDSKQEKIIFEQFIRWVYQRWHDDPSMHIYHYASYEITACRKLMQRYGVCEVEVDQLLRNEVFVDLYKVVKSGLMVGESSYSIKKIEHLYRGARDTEVGNGGDSIVVYEEWREKWLLGEASDQWQEDETLKNIRDYNKDDCDSTLELVDWLRVRQTEAGVGFVEKAKVEETEIKEQVTARAALREKLLANAANEVDENAELSRLSSHMAWTLDFHHREEKSIWWRLFDRMGMSIDELEDDLDCLANCMRSDREPFRRKPRENLSFEYLFSVDQKWKADENSYYAHEKAMTVVPIKDLSKVKVDKKDINFDDGYIILRASKEQPHLVSLLPDEQVPSKPIPEAIQSVAEEFEQIGVSRNAIFDFLKRDFPRIKYVSHGSEIITTYDPTIRLQQVIKAVENLDNSYLTIQGPPGTGKTYTAKHIIADLLKKNMRIGISSNSHKAINNLLFGVAEYCLDKNIASEFFCTSETDESLIEKLGIQVIKNPDILSNLPSGACVVGTTAWGFARNDLAVQFDYLFIDEAGQVSVANLIGMSRSARNLVIMGDQMQLGQPSQGAHPGESGLSILDYLLGDTPAIAPSMGVFLGTTYRMHSKVNQFISDAIYDSKLIIDGDNDNQILRLSDESSKFLEQTSGVVFVPVEHQGNTMGSEEEVQEIVRLVKTLIGSDYTDKSGKSKKIDLDDMLFVAPYNFQVNLLRKALGNNAKVGSVDKFQGQEAPIVFFSLCTSDAAETPRGIDFLYSKNRINVAISRAQALAVVVGSPDLFCPAINSVEQMKKVNLVSRLKMYLLQ